MCWIGKLIWFELSRWADEPTNRSVYVIIGNFIWSYERLRWIHWLRPGIEVRNTTPAIWRSHNAKMPNAHPIWSRLIYFLSSHTLFAARGNLRDIVYVHSETTDTLQKLLLNLVEQEEDEEKRKIEDKSNRMQHSRFAESSRLWRTRHPRLKSHVNPFVKLDSLNAKIK